MLYLTHAEASALTARVAELAEAPAYDCCGCTDAEVDAPDGLCDDCAPRYAAAGEHIAACRCRECLWFDQVTLRQALRADAEEVCL